MEKEWRRINKIKGYEVSNEGDVRNDRTGKILSHSIDDNNDDVVYILDGINKHRRKVHRLVAEAYLEGDIEHSFVKHIDGNKRNNRADNLSLRSKRSGKKIKVLETGKVYDSITECSRDLNICIATVSKCLNYKFYNNKRGLHFEEVE